MTAYEILPCRVAHIRELARTMRSEDREEIELVGLSPRHLLHDLWRSSLDPKAALIEGEVAAVWGDNAPMLARQGSMWLFTAPIIARLPLAYFREARRDIRQRLEMREVLHAHVACTYERSLRFFEMLGFTVGEPIENALFREIRIEREQPLDIREIDVPAFRTYLPNQAPGWLSDEGFGFVANRGSRTVAMGMIAQDMKGSWWSWTYTAEQNPPVVLHRRALMSIARAKSMGIARLHAFCDEHQEGAANWLTRLGFRPDKEMSHPTGAMKMAWVCDLSN